MLISNRIPSPIAVRSFKAQPPAQPTPPPQETFEQKLEAAINKALPQVEEAIKPVTDQTKDLDLTLRQNKAISDQLAGFASGVHGLGVAFHPFRDFDEMTAAWLGATEFHRFSDNRSPNPMLPGLKLKGVNEVCNKQYKVVHVTAPPDWQGQPQAPRFTQIKTDYDKTERVPIDMTYLLEDEKGNHLIAQLAGGRLSVTAHNDQKELVDQFYDRLDGWMDKNNFYKNKVLSYNGALDFQEGLKKTPTSWADIALPPASESLIRSNTVDFFDNLELYKKNGKFANRNLLLAGPPGTGKSMINDILMQELEGKVTFIHVTSKSLTGPEAVAGIFDAAREMGPAVVVLEDLDMLGSTDRNNNSRRGVLNEMLNQLSGVFDNTGMVVVGSTNTATAFDEAMLRPLRFSNVIPMPLPNAEVRQGILSKITRKLTLAPDVDLAALAARTEKFSGAGLTELKELAVQAAIEADSFAEGKHVLLKSEHFEKALETIRLKNDYLEQIKQDEKPPTPDNP